MTDEMKFFLFLIERYAAFKGRPTGEVMKEWDDRGLTQEIYDNYEMYDQERLENAYEDIDSLLATGHHAW
jgi:hypothetical protein